ncbi:MAG: hypothetical protein LBU34_02970 [Planctomycetaceae bacterium]|jgi:hypothetical protein|nr:hypothetical protein [Planctomycetaceae bacterium]
MRTDIQHAAMTLDTELRQYPWFRCVGIGDGEIVVYVSQKRLNSIRFFLPNTWEEIPIKVRYMQEPKPLTVFW